MAIQPKKIKPTTHINHEIWNDFKRVIAHRKGIGKGLIQESLEEALIHWCGGK